MPTTAMSTAAAVESTTPTAVESATGYISMEATAKPATNRSTAAVAITRPSIAVPRTSITVTGPTVPKPRPPINRTPIEAAAITEAATIPGASSDEDAAIEPCRAVVTVRRAGIGVVPVVAVSTSWRIIPVIPVRRYADPNTNCNLSMRISGRWEQEDTEQSEIA